MPFEILNQDIQKMKVDGIVNVNYVDNFFNVNQISSTKPIKLDDLEIINISNLPYKYVINIVLPKNNNEYQYQIYSSILNLAKTNNLESIAIPLLIFDIKQLPRGKAMEIAITSIKTFLENNDMMIYLAINQNNNHLISYDAYHSIREYIDENYEDDSIKFNIACSMCYVNSSKTYNKKPSKKRKLDEVVFDLDLTFTELLFKLIDNSGLTDVQVYKKANIDRKLFSKIKSNTNYQPSKNTVIAFSIALELNLDQTKDLLNRAGYSLSPSLTFDLIISYHIENEIYDIFEINNALFAYKEKVLNE